MSSIFTSLIVGALVWHFWPSIGTKVLDNGSKVAFVAAAFVVTAYNLRTRVVDLILKIEATPTRMRMLCEIASDCGVKLTNLVVLFTCTAIGMGSLGFLIADGITGQILASLASALFIVSCIQFVYILFAFERLEKFMLEDAEEKSKKTERARLLKTS